jgi:dynein heavy chain 1
MFEVQDLRHATLATVSRTGMVWFNQETVTSAMLLQYYLNRIRQQSVFDIINQDDPNSKDNVIQSSEENKTNIFQIQNHLADLLEPYFNKENGLILDTLEYAGDKQVHIMDFLPSRCLQTLFSMLNHVVRTVVKRQLFSADRATPLTEKQIEQFLVKSLIISMIWSFSGDAKLKYRQQLGEFIINTIKNSNISLPADKSLPIIDFEVIYNCEEEVNNFVLLNKRLILKVNGNRG